MNAAGLGASAASLDTLPPIGFAVAHCIEEVESLAAAGEPVVLKGTIDHWPALQAANQSPAALNDYLKARDSGAPVPVMEAPAATRGRFGYAADLREFSFTKRNRPLAETLDRIARTRTQQLAGYIAIQLLPLDERLPGFVRDNPMPIVSPSARPNLWLGGPVKTQIHNDRDHNLACVLAGHRRFVLFPPEQVPNLYIGPLDNPPPLSLVDPEAPDLARFPRFADALKSARVAHLGPGDALLMPRYWWHHVTSRDGYNAMVNYWWGDRAPGLGNAHDAFLTALLALKTLPESERAYWRAMFEAYVFSDDGAAHVPAQSRGLLGPMTSSLRATLKRRLRDTALKS